MPFSKLGLKAELLRAVEAQGYTVPTPIQLKAIPAVLTGRDVLAGAQTGTGKTAAFALPILQMLDKPGAKTRHPRALVLTPTRELAAQVEESIRTYGAHSPLRSTVIFGGVGFNPQADRLRQGIDILVATPGRLLDHIGQHTLDLSCVEILVLDEADRMLDMGFIHDIRKIIKLLPAKRQNMMFSATYSDDIKRLADTILVRPELIEVARRNTPTELVSHFVYNVGQESKLPLLARLIKDNEVHQALVFTRTKHGANRLAQQLCKNDIDAAAIHGNKSQAARTRALADFKTAKIQILVATDIAARGLDIDSLPHVVNYELPNVPEDYIHRIGRTGRAGSPGTALSLVCPGERQYLDDIQRLLGHKILQKDAGRMPARDEIKTTPDTRPERPPRGGGRFPSPRPSSAPRPSPSPRQGQAQGGGRRQERPAGGGQPQRQPRQRQADAPRSQERPAPQPRTQPRPQPRTETKEDKRGSFSLKKLGFWRRGSTQA